MSTRFKIKCAYVVVIVLVATNLAVSGATLALWAKNADPQIGPDQGGVKVVAGTVKSISEAQLVISPKGGGVLTFERNSGTKLLGKIGKDSDVTVNYTEEKGRKIATQVSPLKPSSPANAPAKLK
jgi:hypothetical protein